MPEKYSFPRYLNPELFALIFIFTILNNLPGEAIPRFIAESSSRIYFSEEYQVDKPGNILEQVFLKSGPQNISIPAARRITSAGGVIVDLSDKDFEGLKESSEEFILETLEQTLTQHATRDVSTPSTSRALWNYEISGIKYLKNLGLTGHGTRLGVIANEYGFEHKALAGRIKTLKILGQTPSRSSGDLNLVHPLGILAGYEENKFEGIASETEVSLVLLSSQTSKTTSLLEGIEFLISQPEPPQAILICTDFSTVPPVAVKRALAACRNLGIIPIVAAGNNPNKIVGMASLPSCVTVGAIDRWGHRALFSGQGPAVFEGSNILKPDFAAPGSAVLGPSDNNAYKLGSGTLQAAAHFAGVFLLIRQARPEADPEYILSIMKITASDLDDAGADYQTGAGLVTPAAVISYIDNPPSEN